MAAESGKNPLLREADELYGQYLHGDTEFEDALRMALRVAYIPYGRGTRLWQALGRGAVLEMDEDVSPFWEPAGSNALIEAQYTAYNQADIVAAAATARGTHALPRDKVPVLSERPILLEFPPSAGASVVIEHFTNGLYVPLLELAGVEVIINQSENGLRLP